MDNRIFASNILFILFLIGSIVLAGVLFCLPKIIDRRKREIAIKRKQFVIENSETIHQLEILNEKYQFHDIKQHAIIERKCNSKKEFERFDLTSFFHQHISDQYNYYQLLMEKVEYNKELNKKYVQEYDTIKLGMSSVESDLYKEYKFFEKVEQCLFVEMMLNPVFDPEITVKKSYTSPQGRNYYEDKETYDYIEIKECFESIGEKIRCNEINDSQYERSLMTDSLRYDILKRDGFRCVLCGASAKDGVKLHVDHIFPVSKGGKTEPDNLRTLCESCNRGKGAKYDYNGVN